MELCAIAEELGRAVAPIPFASTVYILAEAVMAHGSDEQKAAVLPRIAAGELIGCLATSEGPGVIAPSSLQARVEGGKLSGVKIPVTDGDAAGMALVLASEGGRPGLFLVDLKASGVKAETLQSLDPTRGVARLTFDGAVADRLGEAGEGLRVGAGHPRPRRRAACLRATGRRRPLPGDGPRIRPGPLRLRPRHRRLPGDEAQDGRHVRQERGCPLQRLLRGPGP